MRLSDLRQKEVINVCSCTRIGCVMDVEIDTCTGCVKALIVPDPVRFCGLFGRESEHIIRWCDIRQIGEDIILVELCEGKPPCPRKS